MLVPQIDFMHGGLLTMNSSELKEAIRVRFPSPEWAVFYEVTNATGSLARRYADAVAMNLYPSRGLTIAGFEIKVSRTDLVSELRNPEKSVDVQQYCDEWWLVTPKDLVKSGELPATWGLLEYKGGKLHCEVKAPKLDPKPFIKTFAASLVRRAGQLDGDQIREITRREGEKLEQQYRARLEREIKNRFRELEKIKESVVQFEKTSGIKIDAYNGDRIGAAVQELFTGYSALPSRLQNTRRDLARSLADIDSALAELVPLPQSDAA